MLNLARIRTLAALTAALALLGLAAGAQAAALPKLLSENDSNSFRVGPSDFGFTGDGSGFMGRAPRSKRVADGPGYMHWTTWTTHEAKATGTVWLDNCTPDCASGTFHSTLGTLVAFRPVDGRFTRATLSYSYGGYRNHGTLKLHLYPGYTYQGAFYPGYWGWT